MQGSAVNALPHGFDQRVERDRFSQDALHVQPFEVLSRAGHDNDWNVSRRCARRDVLLDDQTVDNRQAQVEHDRVRRIAVDSLQGLEAVTRFVHLESCKAERGAVHMSQRVVVFHDEHGCAGRHCGMIRD
jgi:hypothetical protein